MYKHHLSNSFILSQIRVDDLWLSLNVMKMMVQLMLLIEVPNTKRAAENLGSVRSE
jgi:hypothetical protein